MKAAFERLYFFFVLATTSGAISRVLGGHGAPQAGGENSTPISGGNSDPLLLLCNVALASFTLLLGFPKFRAISAMLLGMAGIPLLYLFAFTSLLWTADRVTTFRALAYLVIFLTSAAYFALRFENEEILRYLGNSAVIFALASVAGQYLMPPNGDMAPGWTGVFPQKNDLGAAMAIGIAALMVRKGQWNLARIGAVSLCATLLVLSESFTSIVAATGAAIAVLYLRSNRHVRLLLILSTVGAGVLLMLSLRDMGDTFTSTTGKDLTFTGRTAIWELVLGKIAERPLLGYGYGAFWTTQSDAINQLSSWKPGQAHNGYLDICLSLGVAGLCFVLYVVREALRRGRRLRNLYRHNAGVWMLVVTLLLLVRNFAEASFLDQSITWFVLLLSCFSAWNAEAVSSARVVYADERQTLAHALNVPAVPELF